MSLSTVKFRTILFGLAQVLKYKARKYPTFHARLRERDLIAQIKARDEEIGRWYAISGGKITSGQGLHPKANVTLAFKSLPSSSSIPMFDHWITNCRLGASPTVFVATRLLLFITRSSQKGAISDAGIVPVFPPGRVTVCPGREPF